MITNDYIAILTLKYILENGKTGELEEINSLTEDDFLRNYIPLACYWSNDLIDVCFAQLNVEQPEEYPSYNSNTHEKWYEWFETTINEKWLSVVHLDEGIK